MCFADFLGLLQKLPRLMEAMMGVKVSVEWRSAWSSDAFKDANGNSPRRPTTPQGAHRATHRRRSQLLSKKMNRPRSVSQIQFGRGRSLGVYNG